MLASLSLQRLHQAGLRRRQPVPLCLCCLLLPVDQLQLLQRDRQVVRQLRVGRTALSSCRRA